MHSDQTQQGAQTNKGTEGSLGPTTDGGTGTANTTMPKEAGATSNGKIYENKKTESWPQLNTTGGKETEGTKTGKGPEPEAANLTKGTKKAEAANEQALTEEMVEFAKFEMMHCRKAMIGLTGGLGLDLDKALTKIEYFK